MLFLVPVSLDKCPLIVTKLVRARVLKLRLYVLIETCLGRVVHGGGITETSGSEAILSFREGVFGLIF